MKRQWAILMIGLLAAGCDPASRAKGYIEAMRTDDEQRYYQAADQLRHLLHTDPEAIPATTAALADPDYRVRAGAAYGLGADLCNVHPYPTDRVAPALTGVLGDGDPAARISAANSLATLHRPDPKVLAVLIDGLSHRQPRSRRQAAEGLAAMPSQPTAVPALTALLERRDALDSLEQWRAWQAAAGALGKAGPAGAAAVAALAALIELDAGPVGDERRWARQSAAAALGQIGPAAAQAIPALIRQLDDPDLRAQCPTALGKIGPGALEPLLDTLRNGPASRKGGALDALHAMGPHAAPAVPLLLEMLRSRSGDTMGIALALGSIGPPARVAIPALVRALAWVSPPGSKGFEDKVTFVIERVIDQLGPAEPAGVPELIAALGDANAQVRRWAAIELGRIGPHARAAVAPLERLAAQSDAPASTTFLGALVRIDPSPSRLAPLVALLSAKDAMTRCLAVMQLGSLGPAAAAALPALRQAAQSHDSGLRAFADAAIKNISAATRPASTSSMP